MLRALAAAIVALACASVALPAAAEAPSVAAVAKNYADNLIQSCAAWSGELLMPPRVTYVCSLMP